MEIICILDSLMVASEHELQGGTKSRFYDYQNNHINVDEGYQNERSFVNIGSEVSLDREEKQASCMFSSISNNMFITVDKSIPLSVDKIFLQITALQLQLARTPIRMGIHGLCAGTRALSGRLEVHAGKHGIRLHQDHVRTV